MKRIGVLGGMSAQANHRELPIRADGNGQPIYPRQIDPRLVDAAAWLGRAVDFIVIPCNTAHVGVREIAEAAGCPVLSMIDVTLDDVGRRGATRVGVLGYGGALPFYVGPLGERAVECETIDGALQAPLGAGLRAVMEGGEGAADRAAARAAAADDLIDPAGLLAEAAVRLATT